VTDRDGNRLDKRALKIERKRSDIQTDSRGINQFRVQFPRQMVTGMNDSWGINLISGQLPEVARISVFDRSGQRLFYTEDAGPVRWRNVRLGKEMPVGLLHLDSGIQRDPGGRVPEEESLTR